LALYLAYLEVQKLSGELVHTKYDSRRLGDA